MPQYEVTIPNKGTFHIESPTELSDAQVYQAAVGGEKTGNGAVDAIKNIVDFERQGINNIGAGAIKGAANIGATLLAPYDYISDKITGRTDPTLSSLITGKKPESSNDERRRKITEGLVSLTGADPNSLLFKGGELGSEIAGTSGVGKLIAGGAKLLPVIANNAPKLVSALETGGFKLGGAAPTTIAGKIGDAATRIIGGGVTGGATAGLINPSDAGTGAVLGGALPPAAKIAGAAGKAIGSAVSPEVSALYQKARALGIDIPVDRILNSKPVNALAASLNYIPFSGRAGTEERLAAQVNRALSKTVGQDSTNVTGALRKASDDLGQKFDTVLQNNSVKFDNAFQNDLISHADIANKELSSDGAKIIHNQINEILSKVGTNGEIDGQAAYNIKKTLDRIGNRNSPEAFYARELKKSLMGALNRSLGPQEAAKFATVRRQYGNMLDLENLAQNGAEGGISIGRLANLKNINNPELQDIADIAAQFIKTRESPHGAMQRVVLGSLAAGAGGLTGTLPLVLGGIGAGRAVNSVLNNGAVKSLVLNQPAVRGLLTNAAANPIPRGLLYGTAANQ